MRLAFRGAVFDADGTLLDSMQVWRNLGERYLLRLGLAPEKGLSARLWPLSFEQGCGYIKEHYGLKDSVDGIKDGISGMIEDFYRHEAELKPGVREFLGELGRRKITMVIATSGDRELLCSALKRNGIDEYFSRIFTCSELNTDKRHPEIFRACAEALGLPHGNIAVFEDSLFALETARAEGFITIGIEDASSINDRARIIGISDYYVRDWRKVNIEDGIDDSRQ